MTPEPKPKLLLQEEEVEEYPQRFTDEAARKRAEELGCYIEYADDYTLQLDLDSEEALRVFERQYVMLVDLELASFLYCTRRKSRSGNTHVTITLRDPLPIERRILLQALLGSDLKREALTLAGYLAGQENPVLLFRPRTHI